MSERFIKGAAALIVLFSLTAMGLTGCVSNQHLPDANQMKSPGHLALISADTQVLVTSRDLVERATMIRSSNAFAQFKDILENFGPDAQEEEDEFDSEDLDDILGVLQRHLKGRVTMSVQEKAEGDEGSNDRDSEFLIILDADVIEFAKDLRGADREDFVMLEEGITQLVDSDPDTPDDFFFFQAASGPEAFGFITSSKPLLLETISRLNGASDTEMLLDDLSFTALTKTIDPEKGVFLWVRDWSAGGDEWSNMLGGATGQPLPNSIAASIDLSTGLDVQMEMDIGVDDIDGANLKEVYPMLSAVERAPSIPAQLPSRLMAYTGVQFSLDIFMELLKTKGMANLELPSLDNEQATNLIQAFLAGFEGEFGLAVTSAPRDTPRSAELGFALPGFALIAKLKDNKAERTIAPLLDLALSGLREGPTPLLHSPTLLAMGEKEVSFFQTPDPGLSIGFVFEGEYLLVGNPQGIKDMLEGMRGGEVNGTDTNGQRVIKGAFNQESNYQAHLNLSSIYDFVRGQFGFQLKLFTGGILGSEDDPLVKVFRVFEFVGGSITFHEERASVRLYITAKDLAPEK